MGFPLKADYKPGKGLSQISASDLNTVANVLNTIGIAMVPAGSLPEVNRASAAGTDWKFVIPAGGGASVPDGTVENPHLVWDPTAGVDGLGAWIIGVIVPNGTSDNRNLIWDVDAGKWSVGTIMPDGGDTPCVAIWSPDEDAWTALNMGNTPYKYLGLDSGGNPVIDYVRWA